VAGGVREGACPGHNAVYYTRLCALVADRVSWKGSTFSSGAAKKTHKSMPGPFADHAKPSEGWAAQK
jgi:hypothetical protein